MTDSTNRTARTGAPDERVETADELISRLQLWRDEPSAHVVELIEQRDAQVRQEARRAALQEAVKRLDSYREQQRNQRKNTHDFYDEGFLDGVESAAQVLHRLAAQKPASDPQQPVMGGGR